MHLSSTARYALRAVVHIARRAEHGAGPIPMQRIADATQIPSNYLSKILHQLARSGILASTRGPGGGFDLAVPPDELILADVTEPFMAMEGPLPCLLGDRACNLKDPCVAHDRWSRLAREFRDYFESTTVAALVREE